MVIWKEKRDTTGCIIVYSLLLSSILHAALAAEVVFGLQLNDDAADSYGASMAYDAKTHRLYITGSTYSGYFKTGSTEMTGANSMSDCFFGVLQLPQQIFMSPQWIRRVQIGIEDASEACSALHVAENNGDIYLVGHADHSTSVMSPLASDVGADTNNPSSAAAGLVMHLSRGANLVGGIVMEDDAVQYPIAIQGDATSDHLFVVAIKSKDGTANPHFEQLKQRTEASQIDMSTAGYLPPEYGSNYTILVKSLKRDKYYETAPDYDEAEIRTTLVPAWSREFGLGPQVSLQVSALLYVSLQTLVLAGSIYSPSHLITEDGSTVGEGNWDGYLLMIDPATGAQQRSQLIKSSPQGDDRILGLCKSDSSSKEIFAVGITEGTIDFEGRPETEAMPRVQQGSYQAFILKMNAETMETLWVSYVGAVHDAGITQPPQVHGMACAVTSDGKDVYLGGTVKDGAVLTFENTDDSVDAKSYGKDDIFVAQYDTANGKLNYAKQLGTSFDDSLGQGTSLVTNANGDVIVLGNTNGSLMRNKATAQTVDMFVLSLARKRGHHLPFFESMMDIGPTESYEGFSKSTNPYYIDAETDDKSYQSLQAASFPEQIVSEAPPSPTDNEVIQEQAIFQPVHLVASTPPNSTPLQSLTQMAAAQKVSNETVTPESTETFANEMVSPNVSLVQAAADLGNDTHITGQSLYSDQQTNASQSNINDTTVESVNFNSTDSHQQGYNGTEWLLNDTIKALHRDDTTTNETTQDQGSSTPPSKPPNADAPWRDPELPSYEAESGALVHQPPQLPHDSLDQTPLGNTLTPQVDSSTPQVPTSQANASSPSNTTSRPISNIRTQAPGVETSMPMKVVFVSTPGVAKENWEAPSEQTTLMPYVVSLIVLANMIFVVGAVLGYFYRRHRSRKARIVPGLDDIDSSSHLDKSFAESQSETDDISMSLQEGRWKPESDVESVSIQCSPSLVTLDGKFLLEMRPPVTPPHPLDAVGRGQDFCGDSPWDTSSQSPNVLYPQESSVIDIGDKYGTASVCSIDASECDKYTREEP